MGSHEGEDVVKLGRLKPPTPFLPLNPIPHFTHDNEDTYKYSRSRLGRKGKSEWEQLLIIKLLCFFLLVIPVCPHDDSRKTWLSK